LKKNKQKMSGKPAGAKTVGTKPDQKGKSNFKKERLVLPGKKNHNTRWGQMPSGPIKITNKS